MDCSPNALGWSIEGQNPNLRTGRHSWGQVSRGFWRATSAVLALGLGNRTRQEDRDPVSGADEDQGAGRRGACPGGRAGEREADLGRRGAGLEGY